jgi:hypothetical protein
MTGTKDLMERNVQEHKDFEGVLERFRDRVFKTNIDAYGGQKLKAILNNFGPTLEKHLHREIQTLLDLAIYDSQNLLDIWNRAEKIAKSSHDRHRYDCPIMPFLTIVSTSRGEKLVYFSICVHRTTPFMIGYGDRTFSMDEKRTRFPDIPFFVPYLREVCFAEATCKCVAIQSL